MYNKEFHPTAPASAWTLACWRSHSLKFAKWIALLIYLPIPVLCFNEHASYFVPFLSSAAVNRQSIIDVLKRARPCVLWPWVQIRAKRAHWAKAFYSKYHKEQWLAESMRTGTLWYLCHPPVTLGGIIFHCHQRKVSKISKQVIPHLESLRCFQAICINIFWLFWTGKCGLSPTSEDSTNHSDHL